MPKKTSKKSAQHALERIGEIRQQVAEIDMLCTGTLLKRMMTCGSPTCRCIKIIN